MNSLVEDMEIDGLRPTPHNEESVSGEVQQMAANLTLSIKFGSFMELVAAIKYLGFLRILEICNGPLKPYMRPAVELRWSNLLEEEFKEWVGYQLSGEAKKRQLEKGLAQRSAADAEEFWVKKVTEEQSRLERVAIQHQKGEMNTVEEPIGIKIPVSYSFLKLKNAGYKAFLTQIFTQNGPDLTRGVVEAEWKRLVNKLFLEWNPPAEYETREEINALLEDALNQINGIGKYNPKTYWVSDDPNSLRHPMVAEKAAAKVARKAVRVGRVGKRSSRMARGVEFASEPRKTYNTRSNARTISNLEAMVSQLGL